MFKFSSGVYLESTKNHFQSIGSPLTVKSEGVFTQICGISKNPYVVFMHHINMPI